METILLKILEIQNEILSEVRQLRQALTHGQPVAAAPAAAPEPIQEIAPPSPPPADAPPATLTMDELANLGDQFLDSKPRPKAKTSSIDVADLKSALLDDIKAKNKAKRNAFAEFDRVRRER